MQRPRPIRALTPVVAFVIAATMVAFATVISSAAPPLVAQAGTAAAPSSVAPTGAAGSVTAGTAPAASPAIPATVDAGSAVPPPSVPPLIPPPVVTGGGIDRGMLFETLVGVSAAAVFVPFGAWGLIRLIANAGKR